MAGSLVSLQPFIAFILIALLPPCLPFKHHIKIKILPVCASADRSMRLGHVQMELIKEAHKVTSFIPRTIRHIIATPTRRQSKREVMPVDKQECTVPLVQKERKLQMYVKKINQQEYHKNLNLTLMELYHQKVFQRIVWQQ